MHVLRREVREMAEVTSPKYRCKNCHRETSIVTLGEVYSGCLNCFCRYWEELIEGEWIDKNFKNEKTDSLMRLLNGVEE